MKRRNWLRAGAVLVTGIGVAVWQRNSLARHLLTNRSNDTVTLNEANLDSDICVLTPEQVEGPYFTQAPDRVDIRDDRKGIALDLEFEILQASDCSPVAEAQVHIWHCDAAGVYSGYDPEYARKPFDTIFTMIRAGGPDVTGR